MASSSSSKRNATKAFGNGEHSHSQATKKRKDRTTAENTNSNEGELQHDSSVISEDFTAKKDGKQKKRKEAKQRRSQEDVLEDVAQDSAYAQQSVRLESTRDGPADENGHMAPIEADNGLLICPFDSCPRHNEPFKKQSRLNKHIRREHDTDPKKLVKGEVLTMSPSQSAASNTKQKKSKSKKHKESWSFSDSISGTFIDHDPILSHDGQHMILPTKADIQIYSTKTSLLVRRLRTELDADIKTICLDTSDKYCLYAGLSNGTVQKWDWSTGRRIWSTTTETTISGMAVWSQNDETQLLVLRKGSSGAVDVLTLITLDGQGELVRSESILEKSGLQSQISVLEERTVLVCSLTGIYIGLSSKGEAINFHEMTVSGRIVSSDARLSQRQGKSGSQLPCMDIAVGLKSGIIQVYHDLLPKIISAEKGKPADLVPSKLHWHRNRVNTVKWSKDGMYLVSGGNETVLVLWQLDTNNKQFLPHLATPILNLTISQAGDAYALRLGDNSVMLLSTADLKPAANVSGLAISGHRPQLVMHPLRQNELLAITSSDARTPDPQSIKSSNILQTFDISSAIQLNKQALARNFLTTVKVGSSGQTLKEPEVSHFAITSGGNWMVTVDEWVPPTGDIHALYLEEGDEEAREGRKESFLRFWSFNVSDQSWELNTRIDDPVSQCYRSVLTVATNPSKAQICTAGSDGALKIWSPKARVRNGQVVKNAQGHRLFTWTCDRTISLEQIQLEPSVADRRSATAAFSEDGSCLAVSWSHPDSKHRHVHVINSSTGELSFSQAGLLNQGHASLAFSGSYLIALSRNLSVFNLIDTQIVAKIQIDDLYDSSRSLLAVNTKSSTIAIALSSRYFKDPSKLMIYRLGQSITTPIYETLVKGQVRGILPSPRQDGFIIIDGDTRIRHLLPAGEAVTSISNLSAQDTAELNKGLDSLFGTVSTSNPSQDNNTTDLGDEDVRMIEDSSAGQNNTLEEVFNIQSTARAPSLSVLFNSVARAVSGMFSSSSNAATS